MSHNTLYPACIRINYSSTYGIHSMTIPSTKFVFTGGAWNFEKEDLSVIGVVNTLVTAWVNIVKTAYPANCNFIDWQAFTFASPTDPAQPLVSGSLGIVGTHGGGTGYSNHATQATHTWRTNEFGIFKLVWLDLNLINYEKNTNVAAGQAANINATVTGANTWMRGRDGGIPQTFLQSAYTLNEKLRKAYRMN